MKNEKRENTLQSKESVVKISALLNDFTMLDNVWSTNGKSQQLAVLGVTGKRENRVQVWIEKQRIVVFAGLKTDFYEKNKEALETYRTASKSGYNALVEIMSVFTSVEDFTTLFSKVGSKKKPVAKKATEKAVANK